MKNIISKLFSNERIERAIKTFIEAFFSYVAVNILTTDLTEKSAIYALISGAIASAFSVALNIKLNKK